jgi:hypothetical protein
MNFSANQEEDFLAGSDASAAWEDIHRRMVLSLGSSGHHKNNLRIFCVV